MKSYRVHYLNKYPGGFVHSSEDRLDAHDAEGNLRVSLRLDGNGRMIDAGRETGALDEHCLSPIPKNTRVYKLYADGRVAVSEEGKERALNAKRLAVSGKVLSIDEYKKSGYTVDADGNVSAPKRIEVEPQLAPQGQSDQWPS